MVAVFDEWGLGYADGMPSSSHKSALQSIVKHEKRLSNGWFEFGAKAKDRSRNC